MKPLIFALSLALAASATFARTARVPAAASPASEAAAAAPATAIAATQPGTPQRSKMKACNAGAKEKSLHGDERRAFMKQCLSKAKTAAAAS